MINEIPADIHWLIKVNVQLTSEFCDPFVSYMSGFSKNTTVRKRRVKRLGCKCHNCIRLAYNKPCCKILGMVSVNREDKIKFVKNDMSKELLDDILRLRRIRVDMCNVRFTIYGSCSKKKKCTV